MAILRRTLRVVIELTKQVYKDSPFLVLNAREMWKYVSRRVKDTLERSSQVLDVGRSTFCSSSAVNNESQQQQQVGKSSSCGGDGQEEGKQVLVYNNKRAEGHCISWFRDRSRCPFQRRRSDKCGGDEKSGAGQERRKERLNRGDIGQSWLGALTWSSAIVCGWYTSQYICLRRKRMGWYPLDRQQQSSCAYASVLLNTTRSLHTNITSRIALAAPPPPNYSGIGALLQNVNNELNEGGAAKGQSEEEEDFSKSKSKRTSSTSSTSSLDSAVAEFSVTIGEIEYQFGVQDLLQDNFKSAVNHLKLATTHHHPAATFNLGLCYERGLGVDRDLKMAMQCYTVASSLGHAKAMYNLGVFYVRGWGGLKRSRKAARECFDSAARLGQENAKMAMDLHRQKQMVRSGGEAFEPKLMSAVKDVGFGVRAF